MIGIIFEYRNEIVEVRVFGDNLYFRTIQSKFYAPIEGLRFSYPGVVKEHPDLEGVADWREQAVKRLKDKIKSLVTEDEKKDYVIKELSKVGYMPKYYQKEGFRPVKL